MIIFHRVGAGGKAMEGKIDNKANLATLPHHINDPEFARAITGAVQKQIRHTK